jgi:hypothetical protein
MFMPTNRIQVTGLAATLLLGCGAMDGPDKFFDPDLTPFLEKFISEANDNGVDMPGLGELKILRFVDNFDKRVGGKHILGLCKKRERKGLDLVSRSRRWREVLIKRSVAGSAVVDNKVLEYIIYHELGHCLLNLDHSPPLSAPRIMRAKVSLTSGDWLRENWTAVVGELFTFGGGKDTSTALIGSVLPEADATSNKKEVCGLAAGSEIDGAASLSNLRELQ